MKKEIPYPIKPVFDSLDTELSWLNLRWHYYSQLYRTSDDRLELLQASATTYFAHLRWILLDDMLLGICRISDKAKTAGKKNITFRQLYNVLCENCYSEFGLVFLDKLESIESHLSPFKDHRNKRISHSDLHMTLEKNDHLLPSITYEMIEDVIREFNELLNLIHMHFTKTDMLYDLIVCRTDASVMIEKLKEGMFFDKILRSNPVEWFQKYESSRWFKA